MKKLRTSKDVLDELNIIKADITKAFNQSHWQKEKDFYEARFFFIVDIIKRIENKMDNRIGNS